MTWATPHGETATSSTSLADPSLTKRLWAQRESDRCPAMSRRLHACWVMIHPGSESFFRQTMNWGRLRR